MVDCDAHICFEPYDEYASILSSEHSRLIIMQGTWDDAVRIMPPSSIDTVVLLDVIEHLPKDEGRRLLEATVSIARSQVVVFTPLGFMPQGDAEDKDAWGLGGTDWQVHRSGWTPDDFEGWEFLICEDFHRTDAYGRELETPHGAFFAILNKADGAEADLAATVWHWRRTSNSPLGRFFSRVANRSVKAVTSFARRRMQR
ncbi:MAG: hypothetical protein JXR33_05835 [Coriobacteriia bacterium]|nr:hypothetical protein [Coriobacteriia bacterium]